MAAHVPIEHYRLISAHAGDIVPDDIEVNSAGNDHVVYFVRRQATFRFPRTPRRINPTRKNFLDAFAQRSPVPVPLITIHHDEQTDIDYEINTYLPGVPFEPALANALPSGKRHHIAHQLGRFLTALHGVPLDDARALGMDELDPVTFGDYMADNPAAYPYFRTMVFPSLTPHQRRWVDRLFTDYVALVRAHPFPVRVAHADMWPYHILVDPESATLTGILDYWPRIADPANDFKVFEAYGADFVAAVYQQYTLPRDASFDRRRLFYTGHDQVAELARAIERGNPEQIAARSASLAAYIAQH